MPTDNQSVFQSLIESGTGLNATAQNSQPAQPNNGNPNTMNNTGQQPITNPNQVYTLPPMSNAAGNWWVPQSGSGVDTQAILGALPQSPSSGIDNILANLRRPPAPAQPPGGTPPPGTTPPPTTPPGTPPANPIGSGGSGGSRPVGPISGGIHNWMTGPNTGQPPSGVAPTNLTASGLGRQGALPWQLGLPTQFGGAGGVAYNPQQAGTSNGNSGLPDWLRNLGDRAVEAIKDRTGNLGFWQQVLDVISEPWIPGDFFNSQTGEMNSPSDIFNGGPLTDILRGLADRFGGSDDEMVDFDEDQLLEDLNRARDAAMARTNAIINERINNYYVALRNQGISQDQIDAAFPDNASEWTPDQWQDMMETMGWNDLWHGSAPMQTGGTNRTQLPTDDLMGQFLANMHRQAEERSQWFRNMRGTIQQ